VTARAVGLARSFGAFSLGALSLGARSLGASPAAAYAAAPPPDVVTCAAAATSARRWPAPLDRTVTLPARESTLRDALDRLAAAAHFSLSYAAELLPLDRRVCVGASTTAAGDALVALLGTAAVEPVVVADDQVVLAPSRAPRAAAHAETRAESSRETAAPARRLQRVLVTGSPDLAEQASPYSSNEVVRGGAASGDAIAGALDAVPGVWSWSRAPSSFLARYGSIRGASSFGVSAPKIYIDGIEAANPLLITGLVPESVDRVTVVRGPQGAALYGADAIDGVIDVETRHDAGLFGAPRVEFRSEMGPTRGDLGENVLGQRYALSLHAGSATRSATLGASLATLGDFVPNGSSREAAAFASARVVGSHGVLALTARYLDKSAGLTPSPLLTPPRPSWPASTAGAPSAGGGSSRTDERTPLGVPRDTRGVIDSSALESTRQYTLGATVTRAAGARWTQQAVVGVDGYRLSGPAALTTPFASVADSVLRASRGGADRFTFRAREVGRFTRDDVAATVTLGAEHSALREVTDSTCGGVDVVELAWRNSTGLLAQTTLAWRDAVVLSGGLRVERDAGYGATSTLAALPTLGASVVREVAGARLTLRGAYGRAIRPPREGRRDALSVLLAPETQAGTEAGADLALGTPPAKAGVTLHATRFDQRVTGLVQPVLALGGPVAGAAGGAPFVRRLVLGNLGEIANRGWELAADGHDGPLSLGGTLSLVDSRVARTGPAALTGGALRAGDRMLDVPARTATLTAAWTMPRWSLSAGVSHAADWVDYDRLALTRDVLAGTLTQPVAGAWLRAYRETYGGVTRLRAGASRDVGRGLALTLTGENLLNRQRGEPDDATVVPGRSVALGVRAKF